MEWIGSRQAFHTTHTAPSGGLPKFGNVVGTRDPSLPLHLVGLADANDCKIVDDFLLTLSTNGCSPPTLHSCAFRSASTVAILGRLGESLENGDTVRRSGSGLMDPATSSTERKTGNTVRLAATTCFSVMSVFYEHQAQAKGPWLTQSLPHPHVCEDTPPQSAEPLPAPAAGTLPTAGLDGAPKTLFDDLVNRDCQ
jgi:hypothetical protein